jgi:hypothetical protein
MTAVVFAGPSLPPSSRTRFPQVHWRPPARHGDVYRAALLKPQIIGLIDGYFEVVPAVWHKEILWAMASGIHIYGAASIGALRAAEMAAFGMIGIGAIYENVRSGALSDDDEVAVLHGPAELDYVQLTVPMIELRATMAEAERAAVIDGSTASALTTIAKGIFYKQRSYERVLEQGAEEGLKADALAALSAWLPARHVEQKRMDALAMVDVIVEHLTRGVTPLVVQFELAHTFVWEAACQRLRGAVGEFPLGPESRNREGAARPLGEA